MHNESDIPIIFFIVLQSALFEIKGYDELCSIFNMRV